MKNAKYFAAVLDLFDELDLDLTDEQKAVIDGATVYESFGWLVIDGARVLTIDTCTGDVLADDKIGEFYKYSLDYANDELN